MLTKLNLGEKLKDLRIAKGYKSTELLANAISIPKTTLNDYENDEENQDVGYGSSDDLLLLRQVYYLIVVRQCQSHKYSNNILCYFYTQNSPCQNYTALLFYKISEKLLTF